MIHVYVVIGYNGDSCRVLKLHHTRAGAEKYVSRKYKEAAGRNVQLSYHILKKRVYGQLTVKPLDVCFEDNKLVVTCLPSNT